MNQETIFKILEAGGQAPSGSNSQPWKFKVSGNQIEIISLPERDHPILNFRYRGTWLAHGALIENILIAASAFGYKASLELFPLNLAARTVAKITLTEDKTQLKDELFEAINLRATNRKPYSTTPLTEEQKNRLLNQAKKITTGEFKLIENSDKIKILAQASSVNEIITLENQTLHNLFFKEIVWTEQEEKEKRTGLYLKTMELAKPQEKALSLFKNWPLMHFLNMFGVAKAIAKTNEKSYAACSAIGAIIINEDDNEFLPAGRIMQRVWLEATKLGLSCHLMTGVLFLSYGIKNGQKNIFSQKHRELIQHAYSNIAQAAGIKEESKIIALLMRIGNGNRPSGLSSRFPIKNISEIQ